LDTGHPTTFSLTAVQGLPTLNSDYANSQLAFQAFTASTNYTAW